MNTKQSVSPYIWWKHLDPSKKVILVSFLIWLAQAIPKWTFVLMADGEATGDLLKLFITPRSDL